MYSSLLFPPGLRIINKRFQKKKIRKALSKKHFNPYKQYEEKPHKFPKVKNQEAVDKLKHRSQYELSLGKSLKKELIMASSAKMKVMNLKRTMKPESRDMRLRNVNNFNDTKNGDHEKESDFFKNLNTNRKNLNTVRGHRSTYSQGSFKSIPRKFACSEIENEVERNIKKQELSTREGILKWLKNPRIRKLVSEEFQKSGQSKKSNLFQFEIQQKKKLLAKLKETY